MGRHISDSDALERRLLELAFTTTAELTPAALAYFAPCSLDDASRLLDDLAARGRIQLDVDADGALRYSLPGRSAPTPIASTALVPVHRGGAPAPVRTSLVLAVALSLFVPGAGHAYARRWIAALGWLVAVSMAYVLIVPGLVLHTACMISSVRAARRANADFVGAPFALAATSRAARPA